MAINKTIQTENLDNGQWSDLVAFDNFVNENIAHVLVEADQDYYNTERQILLEANRKFIDRGKPSKIQGSNTAIDFFTTQSRKTRTTKSGSLTTDSNIGRQGVEISQFSHWQAGIFKITAGTAGHLVKPVCYGINEAYNLTDNDFFQELSLFNPIEFISLQDEDRIIEQVITFPIVTSDANQRENFILNGVIEPIPIRSVISYFSINFPFEPHGITANFGNGNLFLRTSSDDVSSVHTFNSSTTNKRVFLDGGEPMTIANDQGDSTVQVGPSFSYLSFDQNYIAPFNDAVYSRGDQLQSTRMYESDLLEAVKSMKPLGETYLSSNEYSGKTGFIYNNAEQGVDSIAYGGLLR